MTIDWNQRTHWIFDMDGTLTVPAHDFAAFKRANGIPEDQDLLAAADALDVAGRQALMHAIGQWEREVALRARPQPDAVALLTRLTGRGAVCGVLTRNTRDHALLTLEAAELMPWFPDPAAILGRTCAVAKPHPAGVNRLLSMWKAPAAQAVMVGDWVHDVAAGRAAGTATVLVARHGDPPDDWLPHIDWVTNSLAELL